MKTRLWGESPLMMRTGQALRCDLDFEDGVIEFGYRGTDDRAFLGVTFRVGDNGTGGLPRTCSGQPTR